MSVWWGLVQALLMVVAVTVTAWLWVPVFSGPISGATLLVVGAWFVFLGSLWLCPEVPE